MAIKENQKLQNPNAKLDHPMYNEVLSHVIADPRPIREAKQDDDAISSPKENGQHKIVTPAPASRSRIPKFKETVKKVTRERRLTAEEETSDKDQKKPMVRKLRRSSIPKLSKITKNPKPQEVTNKTDEQPPPNDETAPVEEEFDKIYDEIIEKDHFEPTVAETERIIEKIEVIDPEKIENTFEEIVHDYEENKLEPLSLDTIDIAKSRIPLLKRRSEHEIKVPKSYVRSLSLKYDKEGKKEPKKEEVSNGINTKPMSDRNNLNSNSLRESKIIPHSKNKIVKNGDRSKTDKPKDQRENCKDVHRTDIGDNIKVMPVIKHQDSVNLEDERNKQKRQDKPIFAKDNYKEKLIESLDSTTSVLGKDTSKDNNNLKEDTNLVSHILVRQLSNNAIKRPIDSKQNGNSTKEKIDPPKNYDENIENCKPLIETNNRDEDIQIENDTVKYVVKNNTQPEETIKKHENLDQNKMVEKIGGKPKETLDEEEMPIRGKVSRLIRRLHSQESVDDTPKTPVSCRVPKKASMMSKIAMFERTNSPTNINNEPNILQPKQMSKQISKEVIDTAPKIIDEILKPQIRNTSHEDKVDSQANKQMNGIPDNNSPLNEVNVNIHTAMECEVKPHETIIIDNNEKNPNKTEKYDIKDENTTELHMPIDVEKDITESKQQKDSIIKNNRKISDIPTVEDYELYNQIKNPEQTTTKFDCDEGHKLQRAKSVAEIDLGDSIQGKVSEIIKRISSTEQLLDVGVERKEVINIKERPRKRSVSEKIALFERKLIPVEIKAEKAVQTPKVEPKAVETKQEISAEVEKKIAELANAKLKYGRSENVTYIRLRDGSDMPALFFGCALLDKALIRPLLTAAIDIGYRGIDCAFLYGNEKEVGEAIRAKIQDGTVTRQELFITSKLWSNSHRTDLVEPACRASLEAMGLDYFDLYLIHYPVSFKEGGDPIPKIAKVLQHSIYDYMDAWLGMEQLVVKGLARSIGISNFNSVQVARVFDKSKIKPVVNQVECHPYLNQSRLAEFCQQYDIVLCSYGSLGSLGSSPTYRTSLEPVIYDPTVISIAKELGVTPAQVLMSYQIARGHAAVVKASSASRLAENLKSLNIQLEPAHVHRLNQLNRNKRCFDFKTLLGDTHRNYPFHIPF